MAGETRICRRTSVSSMYRLHLRTVAVAVGLCLAVGALGGVAAAEPDGDRDGAEVEPVHRGYTRPTTNRGFASHVRCYK